MHQRALAILLAVGVAIPALLGGYGRAVAICLGPGHEHEATEFVENCPAACSHGTEWPVPVPADDHDDRCDCTDLKLAILDVPAIPRDQHDCVPAPMLPAKMASVVGDVPPLPSWIRPPGVVRHDPGVMHRLALVQSTRLIL